MLSRQLRLTLAGAARASASCRAAPQLSLLASPQTFSQHPQQQQQRRSYHSNNNNNTSSSSSSTNNKWRALGALGALSAGFLLKAAAEEKKSNNVDWDAVRRDIAALLDAPLEYDDGSYGPLFVRLAWHAAGTWDKDKKDGGSNGGLMRFPPEANWGANKGLGLARDLLAPIVARYPGASYADVWTLAGVVAVEEMGGPKIAWRPGRVNHTAETKGPPDGRLPDAAQGQDHVRNIFYRMGFNDQEIVALLGAHSLGRCHTDRSGYLGPWTRAPTTFSNEYFKLLLNETWTKDKWDGPVQFRNAAGDLMMTPADLSLLHDPAFKKWVETYANDEQRFNADFAAAFSKLLELGVPRN